MLHCHSPEFSFNPTACSSKQNDRDHDRYRARKLTESDIIASATVPVSDNDESGSPKLIDSKKYFSLYFISSTNPNVSVMFAIFSNSKFQNQKTLFRDCGNFF